MKICLVGYGHMGHEIADASNDQIVGIIDRNQSRSFEAFQDFDVIIDFSNHENLNLIYDYVKKTHKPLVIGTTGYSDEELEKINDLSKYAPIVFSSNYSLGVILMNKIVREISPLLRETFDVEVIEKHHNLKKDAPSGTAKMLIDSIQGSDPIKLQYGRFGMSQREPLKEIGVHSLRCGTIAGEHEVIYAGLDEVLSIKHEAHSKKIFAKGALKAASFIIDKPYGLYNMEDVLFGGKN